MTDYGPQITAARLYRKTSKTGATYFAGRLGLMKVALLKSKDNADDGSEIWNLVLSEAPVKLASQAGNERTPNRAARAHASAEGRRSRTAESARSFDDPIPFLGA